MNENKFERKEGIVYVLCEHLENGTTGHENYQQWIGEHKRMICCSICHKVHVGGFLVYLNRFPHLRELMEGIDGDILMYTEADNL